VAGDVDDDLEEPGAGVEVGNLAQGVTGLDQEGEEVPGREVGGHRVALDDDGDRLRRRLRLGGRRGVRRPLAQQAVRGDDLGGAGVAPAAQVGMGRPQAGPVRGPQLLGRRRGSHAEHTTSGRDVHRPNVACTAMAASPPQVLLGIDIGGSGIKGAPVDVRAGQLLADRVRILTPQPSTPDAVADVVAEVAGHFDVGGPVGCTFPAVVKGGVTLTAANVDDAWIGCDADRLLTARLGREVHLVNDADAAGLAEIRFGAARGHEGVVLVLTLGTGIGSALFVGGRLVPNTELGHVELRGHDAEDLASENARQEAGLSWQEYAAVLDEFLAVMELLVRPDLIVLGGGGSKKADKFLPLLHRSCPVVPAELRNRAGIVGAALVAAAVAS